jgi:hypothetical protein
MQWVGEWGSAEAGGKCHFIQLNDRLIACPKDRPKCWGASFLSES